MMQRRMIPPKVGRHSVFLAVYWFLVWHECYTGEPFTFRYQKELAEAAGVSPSVITDLKQAWERGDIRWIDFSIRSATITQNHNAK